MSELLSVKNLCKASILKEISFQMSEGEMVAVMGPSGSGKSTLLYNVSGMDQADGGEVWLKDTELVKLSEDEKAAVRLNSMGFVFQNMNMMSNLSVLDNILLPAYHAGNGKGKNQKANQKKYALELMKKLGISELADRAVTQVSGGQLQRACICRSLMNHPNIVFADEPTGALNQSAAAEVMEIFLNLNREGISILLVTHDSKVASKCGRILYLLDGRIEGELKLGRMDHGENRTWEEKAQEEKDREEKIKSWLSQKKW